MNTKKHFSDNAETVPHAQHRHPHDELASHEDPGDPRNEGKEDRYRQARTKEHGAGKNHQSEKLVQQIPAKYRNRGR
ncbi:hypothetical protein ACIPEN_09620 [Herbaspirillum chlorophenolicum]|uniref:Uncharacterized protein n=1 Tax=Herbaspirillum chlorophenolicum TaxID=211589 RepID=A0ABW8EX98_9BURK